VSAAGAVVREELRAPLEMYDLAIPLRRGLEELAACARALADAGINIDAVKCAAFDAPSTCHLLVADGPRAVRVLTGARDGTLSCRPVLVYSLPNRPGTLARYMQALLSRGVTLDFLYQATAKGVVVGAPDLDAVKSAFAAA
jgi:hypothetical protein